MDEAVACVYLALSFGCGLWRHGVRDTTLLDASSLVRCMTDSIDTTRPDSPHASAPAPTARSATAALTIVEVEAVVRDPRRLQAVHATGLLNAMAAPLIV